MQCFNEFTTNIYQKNSTSLASASSLMMTPKEMTSDIILQSGMKADATSGREKLLKDFIYNAFV